MVLSYFALLDLNIRAPCEGIFDCVLFFLKATFFRTISEKYGFVVLRNEAPIVNGVFHKYNDAEANTSAQCITSTQSRRYEFKNFNETVVKSEIYCNEKNFVFERNDKLSFKFYGNACLCGTGNPWILMKDMKVSKKGQKDVKFGQLQ